MSDYTPTTDEVRAVWREWNGYGGLINRVGPEPDREGMVAEFDRWLEQVRREARAEALREAAKWLGSMTAGYVRETPYVAAGRAIIERLRERADREEQA